MQIIWMQSETARRVGRQAARLLDRAKHCSFLCLADGGMIPGNVRRGITRLEDSLGKVLWEDKRRRLTRRH